MRSGVLLAAPVVTVVISLLLNGGRLRLPSKPAITTAAVYGAAAGILWNLGAIKAVAVCGARDNLASLLARVRGF